jgi:hypothetical protein
MDGAAVVVDQDIGGGGRCGCKYRACAGYCGERERSGCDEGLQRLPHHDHLPSAIQLSGPYGYFCLAEQIAWPTIGWQYQGLLRAASSLADRQALIALL